MSAASSSRMSTPESRCSARAAGSRFDFAASVAWSTRTHACRPRLISRTTARLARADWELARSQKPCSRDGSKHFAGRAGARRAGASACEPQCRIRIEDFRARSSRAEPTSNARTTSRARSMESFVSSCAESGRSALRELDARVEAGSRPADRSAQANPPAETPLAVEDLAALAGAHAGPKADLPDALDVADLTWMMHGEVLLATAASGHGIWSRVSGPAGWSGPKNR